MHKADLDEDAANTNAAYLEASEDGYMFVRKPSKRRKRQMMAA